MTTQQTRPPAEHWTCRISLGSTFAYLVSSTRPVVDPDTHEVSYTPIPGYGDELDFIDWSAVVGVMVRHIDKAAPVPVASKPSEPRKRKGKKGKGDKVPEPQPVPAHVLEWIAQDFAREVSAGNYKPESEDLFTRRKVAAWRAANPE